MSDLLEMSYSQANSYLLCKRQRAFSKVDGLKGIPSLASVRGQRYHKAIEDQFNSIGADHPFVQNALDVVREFDKAEPEVFLETTVDNVHVRGYADVIGENTNHVLDIGNNTEIFDGSKEKVVIDWKFPGKHPGKTPKKEYVDQLQLYGLLADADKLMVVFPEHDTAFSFDADREHGKRVLDRLVSVGEEILETKAFERSGMETEPTPNWSCQNWCSYRAVCPLGGS